MRRLKLFVILISLVAAGWLFAGRWSKPVSGQGTLAAPTGVSASDGNYAGKVGIYWDTIRGAAQYRVFRNTTNNSASATDVGTTPANFFFDATAVVGQTYYYWVKAENGATVSAFSASDTGVRGNGPIVGGPYPPLDPPTEPPGNPITAAKAYLGKTLFWDEQLSSTDTVACGTCHRAGAGGTDPRTVINSTRSQNPGFDGLFNTADDVFGSPGVPSNNADGTYTLSGIYKFNEQVTGRKAPSYLNAGYTRAGIFWDGRASDVFRDPLTNAIIMSSWGGYESQALGPPMSSAEMAHTGRDWTQAAAKIAVSKPLALATNIPTALQTWIGARSYPELFQEAFGTPDVTPARIAMAIGTHERVLFTDQTPFDKSEAGIEPLTTQEQNGRVIFDNLLCGACHGGGLLSDNSYHNIGVRPAAEDTGRAAISLDPADNARFKTPSLRNVELRAPYMHNGRFATLEEVVEFYNRGGDFDASNIEHDLIRPLNMTPQEKADLVAFLKRPLTDNRVRNELPPFDRPHLYTESNRVPTITGTGVAGTGGQIPAATAIEPPLVGNPSFTVAVSNGLGGANAVLVINSTDPGTASIPATGSFTRRTLTLAGAGAGGGNASLSLQIPNDPALVGQTFYGRWYVTDAGAAGGFSVSPAFRFTVFGPAIAVNKPAPFDFDGDRKTDVGIFRASDGSWWYSRSSDNSFRVFSFGAGTDVLTPGDWTGDGRTDISIWRPSTGTWYVQRSEDNTYFSFPFGASGDTAAPADYDGDGKTDAAVFRPASATWFILNSSGTGVSIVSFGATGDKPVPADFDGDGKADVAVFRPSDGSWWYLRSSDASFRVYRFGVSTDKPVAGDWTGDGKADIAVWRPSTGEWFVQRSEDGSYFSFPFGASGDVPAPGDYDGDGKTDAAVFRASNAAWFINRSSAGTLITNFGAPGDRPIPNAFVP
ncbi:MAG: VCBS repeat-containing protein [Acidobacteria bacterium]|nr:VCBS repeat-containing protein [Acidobacteriota bacterium]